MWTAFFKYSGRKTEAAVQESAGNKQSLAYSSFSVSSKQVVQCYTDWYLQLKKSHM